MFTHIRSTAPNMFAKFGWKIRTFCHKKGDCQTRVRQTIKRIQEATSANVGPILNSNIATVIPFVSYHKQRCP